MKILQLSKNKIKTICFTISTFAPILLFLFFACLIETKVEAFKLSDYVVTGTCSYCKKEMTTDVRVSVSPTCRRGGTVSRYCSNCGAHHSDVSVGELGHSWYSADTTTSFSCSCGESGLTTSPPTGQHYSLKCSRCNCKKDLVWNTYYVNYTNSTYEISNGATGAMKVTCKYNSSYNWANGNGFIRTWSVYYDGRIDNTTSIESNSSTKIKQYSYAYAKSWTYNGSVNPINSSGLKNLTTTHNATISCTANYGTQSSLTFPSENENTSLQKEGYTLVGWTLDENSSNIEYPHNYGMTNAQWLDETTTLSNVEYWPNETRVPDNNGQTYYAIWIPNEYSFSTETSIKSNQINEILGLDSSNIMKYGLKMPQVTQKARTSNDITWYEPDEIEITENGTYYVYTMDYEENISEPMVLTIGGIPEVGEDNLVDVYVTQASSFSVIIPKTIILGGESKTGLYEVAVKGDIGGMDTIQVVPEYTFVLEQLGKNDINANIVQEKELFNIEDGLNTTNPITTKGTITALDMTAGSWNGSFNFEIKFNTNSKIDSIGSIVDDATNSSIIGNDIVQDKTTIYQYGIEIE